MKKSQGIEEKLLEVNNVLISGMGGGGDVLTALHVRWSLEKKAPHVNWIHSGVTAGLVEDYNDIEIIDQASAWVNEKSTPKPGSHRLIESFIAKKIHEKVYLLSCCKGVPQMVKSLDALVVSKEVEMVIFIDGGTDSLAFLGSQVHSPTEDTMSLATLGLGKFDKQLKHKITGVSIVGSDLEMTLDDISTQLHKIYQAGGYVGGTFFPIERFEEYKTLLLDILKTFPTATAQAPVYVLDKNYQDQSEFTFMPGINGFQLATFLFDAEIAANVGNDFCSSIFNLNDSKLVHQEIRNKILSALTKKK